MSFVISRFYHTCYHNDQRNGFSKQDTKTFMCNCQELIRKNFVAAKRISNTFNIEYMYRNRHCMSIPNYIIKSNTRKINHEEVRARNYKRFRA